MKKSKIIKKAEGMAIAMVLISTILLSLAIPADEYQPQSPDPMVYLTAEDSTVTNGPVEPNNTGTSDVLS